METNDMATVQDVTGLEISDENSLNIPEFPEEKSSHYQDQIEASAQSSHPSEEARKAVLLGQDIDLILISDHLLCPRSWADEAFSHPQLQNAITFLSRLSPCATSVKWLISSMTKDLTGTARSDSQDHASGLAMDIAPMYSDDEILPADPPMAGLAWNIKSLIVLSQGQFGDIPLFIEGDHVHFSSSIAPSDKGMLPIMWSTSTAYQSAISEESDPILVSLRNSFWLWDTSTLTLKPPTKDTYDRVMNLLNRAKADEKSVEVTY